MSINWRPNKNVLCSHSNSKLCLSKSLRLSPSRLIIKTTTYVKEKKTEKFQQKQITEKNEEKEKKKLETGKTTYFYQYHVLFGSSVQVYLH